MLLALAATAIVIVALLWEVGMPPMRERLARHRAGRRRLSPEPYDPGRERRAEQRARALLKSCVNDEEWEMYRDLGFLRVWGAAPGGLPEPSRASGGLSLSGRPSTDRSRHDRSRHDRDRRGWDRPGPMPGAPYAYLIYPHRPIIAYVPQTSTLLSEYCIEFLDRTHDGGEPLPDSDDVLAKWMALTGDERRVIASANMHLPGRQVDPKQVRRDLWRLGRWESERLERAERLSGHTRSP